LDLGFGRDRACPELLDIGQDLEGPPESLLVRSERLAPLHVVLDLGIGGDATAWKKTLRRLERERGQAELLELILAGSPPCRLTSALHGRQEQADQRGNDRDDDEQFHQRKTV